MPVKIRTSLCGSAALALGVILSTSPALAGFQWNEPGDTGLLQAQSPDLSAVAPPVIISGSENVAPVVISGTTKGNPPTQAAGSTRALSFGNAAASVPAPAVKNASIAGTDLSTETISVAPASSSGADVVQGFGSSVPLPLALRQILPSDYSFTVDPTVDMGTLVSYKGGKSWKETLQAMLASAGLDGQIQGSVVAVRRVVAMATVPSALPSSSPSTLSKAPALQPMRLTIPALKSTEATGFLPPPSDVGMTDISSSEVWAAQRGDTLRKVLTDWCGRAGVELKWLAEYDYPIEASSHVSGNFEDAVRGIFTGFEGARPQPIGELHTNSRVGQSVLVVQARGNSYTN